MAGGVQTHKERKNEKGPGTAREGERRGAGQGSLIGCRRRRYLACVRLHHPRTGFFLVIQFILFLFFSFSLSLSVHPIASLPFPPSLPSSSFPLFLSLSSLPSPLLFLLASIFSRSSLHSPHPLPTPRPSLWPTFPLVRLPAHHLAAHTFELTPCSSQRDATIKQSCKTNKYNHGQARPEVQHLDSTSSCPLRSTHVNSQPAKHSAWSAPRTPAFLSPHPSRNLANSHTTRTRSILSSLPPFIFLLLGRPHYGQPPALQYLPGPHMSPPN